MRGYSRRGFIFGGAAALIGVLGWRWMPPETKENLLRRSFEFSEHVSQIFYSPKRLAPEFGKDAISPKRVNGYHGIQEEIDLAKWQLRVGGLAGRSDDLVLTMDDIRALPRTEMTTELKCIEGWSVIVNWAGVRFSDFAAAYGPKTLSGAPADIANRADDLLPYVSLVTPDTKYYVGWDTPSIMHPQTLLAYEMNGQPLLPDHGAPLRLASPTKYGIKQIKRIGRIEFTAERPADFWAESGYDWYSGH
jgi:DMSO/TMAO reductase YedYZ molybdopterin-dependent catalytic subunit